MPNQDTLMTALSNAASALSDAVERYDAMGWYDDSATEDERKEARQTEEAADLVARVKANLRPFAALLNGEMTANPRRPDDDDRDYLENNAKLAIALLDAFQALQGTPS